MNNQISQYISDAPADQAEIMTQIRQLLHQCVPGLLEEFKWSRPVFKLNKDIVYLKKSKAYVTLGFFDFEKLNDPHNRLEGTGKDMRHIKIKTPQDIDKSLLTDWFSSLTK